MAELQQPVVRDWRILTCHWHCLEHTDPNCGTEIRCSSSSSSSSSSSVRAACAHPLAESLDQAARLLLPIVRIAASGIYLGVLSRTGSSPGHPLNTSVHQSCRWRRTTPWARRQSATGALFNQHLHPGGGGALSSRRDARNGVGSDSRRVYPRMMGKRGRLAAGLVRLLLKVPVWARSTAVVLVLVVLCCGALEAPRSSAERMDVTVRLEEARVTIWTCCTQGSEQAAATAPSSSINNDTTLCVCEARYF